jgi:2-dehydropantoate 2-reductase
MRMRIAVMAAGALGGYFGARMAAAGHDVYFIARGANLRAIQQNGLIVHSVHGDLRLPSPNVTDNPADIGEVDLVLFAVKLWDSEQAAMQARPLVGAGTRVIPLQNGIDSSERLVPILGADCVVGGSAYIATVLSAPGVITHTSQFARLVCGRLDGRPDRKLEDFVAAARSAGLDVSLSDDVQRDRWQKFVFLVGLSGATATTRQPLGPILQDSDTRAFFRSLMSEVVTVGRAAGVALPIDYAEDRMTFGDASPPTFKASMLHDLERGNRLELDWLAGKVVELGRKLSVPTPANEAVYAALKLHRMGGGRAG